MYYQTSNIIASTCTTFHCEKHWGWFSMHCSIALCCTDKIFFSDTVNIYICCNPCSLDIIKPYFTKQTKCLSLFHKHHLENFLEKKQHWMMGLQSSLKQHIRFPSNKDTFSHCLFSFGIFYFYYPYYQGLSIIDPFLLYSDLLLLYWVIFSSELFRGLEGNVKYINNNTHRLCLEKTWQVNLI